MEPALTAAWLLPALIAAVAFAYASVGHGGASGYLAVGVLYGFAPTELRPQALLLNLGVATVAAVHFIHAGYFRPALVTPLLVGSIPLAFQGARWLPASSRFVPGLLGACLCASGLRLLLPSPLPRARALPVTPRVRWGVLLPLGAGLGLLSGLTGVGGGIYLSPVLLVAGWASLHEAAAASSVFIVVNSCAGLLGMLDSGQAWVPQWSWLLAALAGGFAGAQLGARVWRGNVLRWLLAGILLLAAWKLWAIAYAAT